MWQNPLPQGNSLYGISCAMASDCITVGGIADKRDLDVPRALRKLDNFDFLLIDDLGYLTQGTQESEALFTLIAKRYECRSLGVTSNVVFSDWEKVFHNPTAAAIDRLVHHSVNLELDVPSYRPGAAQLRLRDTGPGQQGCLICQTP